MRTLKATQVKSKLEDNPGIILVMTLGPKAFSKCHIPGSVNVWNIESAKRRFAKNTEIIVYCSDQSCMSSYYAYQQLERAGYQNIWRFSGGLVEWSQLGYPLAGSS